MMDWLAPLKRAVLLAYQYVAQLVQDQWFNTLTTVGYLLVTTVVVVFACSAIYYSVESRKLAVWKQKFSRERLPASAPVAASNPLILTVAAAIVIAAAYRYVTFAPAVGAGTAVAPAGATATIILVPFAVLATAGFALFQIRNVRKGMVSGTMLAGAATFFLVSILFIIAGYSLIFTEGSPLIGGLSRIFLQGPPGAALSEFVSIGLELALAVIAPVAVACAFAGRQKISALLWFAVLWSLLVYVPVAHWVWGPDGLLASGNPQALFVLRDFAGGVVVHLTAGIAGLVWAWKIGGQTNAERDAGLVFVGLVFAVIGSLAIDMGASFQLGMDAGAAVANTLMAVTVAALCWVVIEWMSQGVPTRAGICTGAFAGLVAITPAAGFVDAAGAAAIGAGGGAFGFWGATALVSKLRIDRSFAGFAIQIVAAGVGVLLTGVFALDTRGSSAGLIAGDPWPLFNQAFGLAIVAAYSAIASVAILTGSDWMIGLAAKRVVARPEDGENRGVLATN